MHKLRCIKVLHCHGYLADLSCNHQAAKENNWVPVAAKFTLLCPRMPEIKPGSGADSGPVFFLSFSFHLLLFIDVFKTVAP
jgi:hypothetical protein